MKEIDQIKITLKDYLKYEYTPSKIYGALLGLIKKVADIDQIAIMYDIDTRDVCDRIILNNFESLIELGLIDSYSDRNGIIDLHCSTLKDTMVWRRSISEEVYYRYQKLCKQYLPHND